MRGTRVVELAAVGHKVIACAWREMDPMTWPGGEPDRGLTFAGLLACADPVRVGVINAVQRCRQAGIHVEWLVIGLVGALITLAVVWGYDYSLGRGHDVEHARAMAIVVLTVASAALTAGLSGLRHRTARLMVTMTLELSVLLVQTPGLATLVNLTPLHLDDWMLAVGGGVLVALLPAFTWPNVRASTTSPGDFQA